MYFKHNSGEHCTYCGSNIIHSVPQTPIVVQIPLELPVSFINKNTHTANPTYTILLLEIFSRVPNKWTISPV